jgi:hypothetical protein
VKNFQLDESLDDKDLAANCRTEGKCVPLRYPPHRKGQKDHVMLPDLLKSGYPLVTLDWRIVHQNSAHITEENGGIIVVKLERATRTITSSIAARIIKDFKTRFEDWATVDWSKIYVELTESDAYLSPLTKDPDITQGAAVRYDDPEFGAKIADLISACLGQKDRTTRKLEANQRAIPEQPAKR